MNVYQQLLDEAIQKTFTKEKLFADLLDNKLSDLGIVLNNAQIEDLVKKILNESLMDSFSFSIDEKELMKCPQNLLELSDKSISITFNSEKDLAELENKIKQTITNIIQELVPKFSKDFLLRLKKKFKGHHKLCQKDRKSFNKHVDAKFGKALDLLEMVYYIATDNLYESSESLDPEAEKITFNALERLHARSCQVMAEIILLLRNGFADGAHARWRTLYELTIIALFISKHGNEISERYFSHCIADDYNAAIKYQKYCEALGYKGLHKKELNKIRKDYFYCIDKYGKEFKNAYGWASTIIKKKNPSFADIEAHLGFEYMRHLYKIASHNVHANPTSLFFKLGLIPENGEALLKGPSDLGLDEPIRGTIFSFVQMTINLLVFSPNLDRLVVCDILLKLKEEIIESLA
ncbi:hypothetical protein BROC_02351 [Candidatus Brocadiaceae bacterium]|nr:hypothetical protein BROC_02351 [Candidatus Brocadiaceae bacterium]